MARDLKKDRKRTNRIVLPGSLKKKYSKRRDDFAGYDTKGAKYRKPNKVYEGKRGGKYVKSGGKKVYLRK